MFDYDGEYISSMENGGVISVDGVLVNPNSVIQRNESYNIGGRP
jgi:hypothetical protein